jgi:D-3-phosphoglycerate dehydrogenase
VALSESKREKPDTYQTLVKLTIVTANGKLTVAGTVFGDQPRIVDMDGLPVETDLGSHMLYIMNHDKPGLIGAVGTILGDAKINIADFTLGRIPGKNKAVALITVDEAVPDNIINAISKVSQVERVLALKF